MLRGVRADAGQVRVRRPRDPLGLRCHLQRILRTSAGLAGALQVIRDFLNFA
jgi:hypothetical protein